MGRPTFGTLISLLHGGRPMLGIIDQCVLRERWVGVRGRPSTCNGAADPGPRLPERDHAVLCATSRRCSRPQRSGRRSAGSSEAVQLPMYGGDCYAYGLLAMGFADLVVEAGLDCTTSWRWCR